MNQNELKKTLYLNLSVWHCAFTRNRWLGAETYFNINEKYLEMDNNYASALQELLYRNLRNTTSVIGFIEEQSWLMPVVLASPHRIRKPLRSDPELEAVFSCPFCGLEHTHGWDDGPRSSHCRDFLSRSYWLVCLDLPEKPLRTVDTEAKNNLQILRNLITAYYRLRAELDLDDLVSSLAPQGYDRHEIMITIESIGGVILKRYLRS